jgi:hypothetical protein
MYREQIENESPVFNGTISAIIQSRNKMRPTWFESQRRLRVNLLGDWSLFNDPEPAYNDELTHISST